MKLLELLVRNFDKWPDERCRSITQDYDGAVNMYAHDKHFVKGGYKVWGAVKFIAYAGELEVASDQKTAIIAREDWEKARADYLAGKVISAKPAKANKDGWIRHRGGKRPSRLGGVGYIEYRMRSGGAGECDKHIIPLLRWEHVGEGTDIMAWRICKTAEENEGEKVMRECVDKCASTERSDPFDFAGAAREAHEAGAILTVRLGEQEIDGLLWWRDRIREIDRTVEALEEERVSLIQRLESEGLQLLRVDAKVCGSAQPVEDLSDWRSWKAGDLLECVDSGSGVIGGQLYPLIDVIDGEEEYDEDGPLIKVGSGAKEGNFASRFKFHRRPQ